MDHEVSKRLHGTSLHPLTIWKLSLSFFPKFTVFLCSIEVVDNCHEQFLRSLWAEIDKILVLSMSLLRFSVYISVYQRCRAP